MSYRPKDWKCPYVTLNVDFLGNPSIVEKVQHDAFEAGADAILDALRKKGVHRDNEPFDAPINTGTWAFIPDEE